MTSDHHHQLDDMAYTLGVSHCRRGLQATQDRLTRGLVAAGVSRVELADCCLDELMGWYTQAYLEEQLDERMCAQFI